MHVCSILLFALPLAVFLKQGSKASNFFWALTLITGLLQAIALLFVPEGLIEAGAANAMGLSGLTPSFFDWHTIIYHYLFLLVIVLAPLLKPYKPDWKEMAIGGLGVFCGLPCVYYSNGICFKCRFCRIPYL